MDRCQSQFSSREAGGSKEDIDKLIQTSSELRTFIQQAAGVVNSQGQKLIGIVVDNASKHPPKKTFSLDDFNPRQSPTKARRLHSNSDVLNTQIEETDNAVLRRDKRMNDNNQTKDRASAERRRASFDVLDPKNDTIYEDQRTDSSPVRPHPPGSPKLLVNPKRTRPGMKASSSVPSLTSSVVKGQEIINGLLKDVTKRMSELERLWEGRKKRLEQWEEVIRFREAAPKVIEWVEEKGDIFLDGKNNYGRSIEEVSYELNNRYTVMLISACGAQCRDTVMLISACGAQCRDTVMLISACGAQCRDTFKLTVKQEPLLAHTLAQMWWNLEKNDQFLQVRHLVKWCTVDCFTCVCTLTCNPQGGLEYQDMIYFRR